jgi:hypothetical protein
MNERHAAGRASFRVVALALAAFYAAGARAADCFALVLELATLAIAPIPNRLLTEAAWGFTVPADTNSRPSRKQRRARKGRSEMRNGYLHSALALLALALGAAAARPAHAGAFDLPCNPLALRDALVSAGANGEDDVLWLHPGCVYAMPVALLATADAGFATTIRGRGATISGLDARRPLFVNVGATVFLDDVRVTHGWAPGDGGGLYNAGTLTLTRSTVSSSRSATGAGIYNAQGARLTLIRSTVSGNAASNIGGGIRNRKGRLTLIDSTVSGNSANPDGGYGGGILNDGQGARATLANCTIFGNSTGFGAGVFNDEGVMAVSHCTIAGNVITDGGNGGGIYYRNYFGMGAMKVGNSVVGDTIFEIPDSGYECVKDPNDKPYTASGINLVEDGSCEITGALSGDPELAGPTGSPAYRPLLPGSPAIDTGTGARCTGVDQRGAPRPRDGDADGTSACDLGSYEAP